MAATVLHVVPAVAARYGGPSAAVLGMARATAAAGVETLVATSDADGAGRLELPAGRTADFEGVPVIAFPRHGGEGFKWAAGLGRWLRDHVGDFDVVHVHAVFSYSTLAAGRACRAADVPYLIRPLGTLDPWSLGRHQRRKRALLGLGLRTVLMGATRMHYTTDEEGRLAEQSLPGLPPGVVVPLGLDDAWFEPVVDVDAREREIVVLARLDPKKGIDLVIRAFQATADHPAMAGYRLTIAGAGDPAHARELEMLSQDGPAAGRITFTGWLDGGDRQALLSRARLFLMPSHQENFGIAAVEAMARATPVIVSPQVNLAGAVERAGAGWVVPRDEIALAGALVAALADEPERRVRAEGARRLADRFTWPLVAAQLRDVYDEVRH